LTLELSELQKKVVNLKQQRNALILAHNYQPMDIQQIADYVGDSLQLAREAAKAKGYDLVIFAGVRFMAEMAAVLVKNIPIYIPAPDALCPLASYLTPEKIRAKRKQYPDAPVVVYVNTTTDAKVECDVICTSSNAAEVVENLKENIVLFGPDANLAEFVRRQTGVELIDIEEKGHCYVHRKFDATQIQKLKDETMKDYKVIILAHPECNPEVQDVADVVTSTGGMVRYVAESDAKAFIIATECGLVEQLRADNPDKIIIPANEEAICIQMKKNTLKQIAYILEHLPDEYLVEVSQEKANRIHQALERMNFTSSQESAAPKLHS
jgi:quinolinate synthase